MFFLYLAIYLKSTSALLISTGTQISTQNITCRDSSVSSTPFVLNCEACLITSRNYDIEQTTLSLTGPGLAGISYTCLQFQDVEAYHENLVRECRYFPRDTLNGYDDFCVTSPYTFIRGSYRACICVTNNCNFDYAQCTRQTTSYWNQKSNTFTRTIVELTDRVNCYQPYNDYSQQGNSGLTPLCSNSDDECKRYVFDHGILCAISVDQGNRTTRQTLVPSIYASYIIKYENELCNSSSSTITSVSFSQCYREETVCMCTTDGCNKDLQTCRGNAAVCLESYSVVSLLFILFSLFCY